MKIAFIHIGKTGGSTIEKHLEQLGQIKSYHVDSKNYQPEEKYIIWIRNPISRFVSAFNYQCNIVNADVNSIKGFTLEYCMAPFRLKEKKKRGSSYVYSEEFDKLMKSFKSANDLAESLTSENLEIKTRAYKLLTDLTEHIFKGIGWYLDNGDFVEKNNNRILFVGKQERMDEDINKLSKVIDITLDKSIRVRENIYVDREMKYMSPLAIKNIIEFYKNTDYLALEVLHKYNWISKETLDSYYIYN